MILKLGYERSMEQLLKNGILQRRMGGKTCQLKKGHNKDGQWEKRREVPNPRIQ